MQRNLCATDSKETVSLAPSQRQPTLGLPSLISCILNIVKMEPASAPPVDGDEFKEYLTTSSIPELLSNLRTAFRRVDYDCVEKVLVENEAKLKYEVKTLTEKLELETSVRISAEQECEGKRNVERYEILLESVKTNNELDHENIVSELRMKNAKLEEEKLLAESEAKFWKWKFEELSERLLMVEKGVNSFMNGDAHVGVGDKAETLYNSRENTRPGVSDEVIGEKDTNVNDICDNEQGNTTAGSSPSQRKDLKSGNTPVSVAEVTRQSLDSPNKALLGDSGISTEDMDKKKDNGVDMDDHECGNITADNCGNAHLVVADDNRQPPDTPNTAVPGASVNASLASQKFVEILDSDDDEGIASETMNGKEASCNIVPAADDIEHSSVSRLFESLKRKWFPEAGNSFDGLNKNLVDGSDTDDDSSSSTSFSDSGIIDFQLPPDFLRGTGDKRRKT